MMQIAMTEKSMNLRKAEALPLLYLFIAGALLPLAFAPLGFYPIAVIAPAVLFYFWLDATPKQAALRGLVFGLGQFGVGMSWIYVAIHDFGHSHFIVAALLTLIFVTFLASYHALVGYISARLRGSRGISNARLILLWLPAWWTIGEWLRGTLFTGFPGLNLGYSMIDAPLRGYAPVVGVYGLTLLVAISAGALLWTWHQRRRGWQLTLPLLLLLWGGGALLDRVEWTTPVGEPIRVTLIQGNEPQLTKWDPQKVRQRMKTYADLTRQHLNDSDLIIWPENAITVFYHRIKESYFDPLAEEARATNTDIILGVPEQDGDGKRYYTTMMSLGSSHAFYRKRHLVPFGEYLPFEGMLRGLINFFNLPMSSFTPGADKQPLLEAAGHKIAASVCYEDVFGGEMTDSLPEATLLVNGSNNAWYGDSLAPHQHLQISRMRALETGRPMLRATTNGISAFVSPLGLVLKKTQQFKQEILFYAIQPMKGVTVFSRFGDWASLIGVWLVIVVIFMAGATKRQCCWHKKVE